MKPETEGWLRLAHYVDKTQEFYTWLRNLLK